MKRLLLSLIFALSLSIIKAQQVNIAVNSCTPNSIITGEETELTISLINNGDIATTSDTYVKITSDDQYVTIIKDSAVYGPIEAGATEEATFVVKVNPMIPDNSIIHFGIEMVLKDSKVISDVEYDFEDGIGGWTTIDADGDGFNWIESGPKLGPDYGHESRFCMFSQSYDNIFEILYPDNYLVSPEKLEIGKDATFSFWACAQDKNYPYEHFGVAVSTESNTSANDFITIKEWTLDSIAPARVQGEWIKYSVDLSEYEGQKIWIAVRHFDCYDQYFMALDDVEINNIYQPIKWEERFTVAAISPTPNIIFESYTCDDITAGKTFDIDITLINKGSASTTYNSKVTLSSDDKYVTIIEGESIIEALDFNETSTKTFSFSTDDNMPENHEVTFIINVEPIEIYDENLDFTYQFEKDFNGWTTIDANKDNHTWYHTSDYDIHDIIQIPSHSGFGHLMSESSCNALYPYAPQLTPDDYVVSPMKIGVKENTTFSLWACAQDEDYKGEHFGIAVSIDGNTSADDFTTIAEWDLEVSSRYGDWIEYSADLSKYKGMFVWVAIRHFKCENIFVINIDDVTISNFARCHNWKSSFTTKDETSLTENIKEFNIYPNPVENELFIETEANIEEISIYDIYGRLCTDMFNTSAKINVADLETGVYFVKIKTDNKETIQRFIKK